MIHQMKQIRFGGIIKILIKTQNNIETDIYNDDEFRNIIIDDLQQETNVIYYMLEQKKTVL